MATITAGMVKELRDKTGAGMMDCKTALAENALRRLDDRRLGFFAPLGLGCHAHDLAQFQT